MDVVYIVGPDKANEELKFSLRSLRNLPHDAVWIVGFIPKWVTGVGRIPVAQSKNKYANSTANVLAACLHPEVSAEFVYFNDDFHVLKPVETMPMYHRGPLAPFLREGRAKRKPNQVSYRGGRADTARLLTRLGFTDPLAYEPIHVPMRFEKAKMLETLETGKDVPALQYRTLYGNQWGVGGEMYPNVKVSDPRRLGRSGLGFISTNSKSFGGRVGRMLREMFPDPSPYEVT